MTPLLPFPDHRSTRCRVWDAVLTHMVIVPLTTLSEHLLGIAERYKQ